MKIGTQIACIPPHANGEITHPDVEVGFVTAESMEHSTHFCRYWRKDRAGIELRTMANSESTPTDLLIEYQSVPQSAVDEWLVRLEYTKPFRVTKAQH